MEAYANRKETTKKNIFFAELKKKENKLDKNYAYALGFVRTL